MKALQPHATILYAKGALHWPVFMHQLRNKPRARTDRPGEKQSNQWKGKCVKCYYSGTTDQFVHMYGTPIGTMCRRHYEELHAVQILQGAK